MDWTRLTRDLQAEQRRSVEQKDSPIIQRCITMILMAVRQLVAIYETFEKPIQAELPIDLDDVPEDERTDAQRAGYSQCKFCFNDFLAGKEKEVFCSDICNSSYLRKKEKHENIRITDQSTRHTRIQPRAGYTTGYDRRDSRR